MQTPFDLFPIERLYPEGARKTHDKQRGEKPVGTKSAAELMDEVVRDLSEKSGLAILACACELTGGNVIFGATPQQQKARETSTKKSYHKDTFYMAQPQHAQQGDSLELDRRLKQAFNIVVVKSNIKYITKDFLQRHGFTLEVLLLRCEVAIEELRLAQILRTFDDLLDLRFKAHDLVCARQLFNTDKLAGLYSVSYEQLRACKRFSFTAYDLAQCQFYPNELMALDFSFEPMIARGYIDRNQLAKLKFSLADMRLLHFEPQHVVQLDISAQHARKLFKWDAHEFAAFCSGGGETDSETTSSESY